MNYAIPKTFKIRQVQYTVRRAPTQRHYGWLFNDIRSITVSTALRGAPLPLRRQSDTFWHEATHAVLHSMKHPQANDEEFVTEFASRLNDVIWTAKF